jgi:hypothetical protein
MLRRPELALLGPYAFEHTKPLAGDPLARWTQITPRPQFMLLDASTAPAGHRVRDLLGETLLFREIERPLPAGGTLLVRGLLYSLTRSSELGEIYEPVMLPEDALIELWDDLIDLGAVNWRLEFVDFAAAGESILTLSRRFRAREGAAPAPRDASWARSGISQPAARPGPAASQESKVAGKAAGKPSVKTFAKTFAKPFTKAGAARATAPTRQESPRTVCSSKELLGRAGGLRAPTETYRQYWTAQEDSRLVQLKAAGKTLAEIAKVLKRTPRAVGSRWERLQATASMRQVFHA